MRVWFKLLTDPRLCASERACMDTSYRTSELRRCPSCARPMQLIRMTHRFDDLPTLHTFQCKSCHMVFTHEAAPNFADNSHARGAG